jgi:dTDP-4-dehydrorhamnose reductase
MKILVTGSDGQLGREIRLLAPEHPASEFIFTDINELNLADYPAVKEFIRKHSPDVIINCAAYTAVDKAETDRETAMEINARSVGNLAACGSESGSFLVHISTDYVFDGMKSSPYTEEDRPNPQSVYASSKYAGELEFMKHARRGIILRTSWLYSPFMNNFVKTILTKGKERGELNVVYDQLGTPTYAFDLASMIFTVLSGKELIRGAELFHFSNEGVASWYDFAKSIVTFSGIDCRIEPILTSQYPLPAQRPFYSVMDKSKFRQRFGVTIPYWRDSLKECIERMR